MACRVHVASKTDWAKSINPAAVELEQTQHDYGPGPCLDAIRTGEPVTVADLHQHREQWPDIEQAKGITAHAHGATIDTAFALIRRHAGNHNTSTECDSRVWLSGTAAVAWVGGVGTRDGFVVELSAVAHRTAPQSCALAHEQPG